MPAVVCAGCGHENREGARFCDNCGAALALLCQSCGAQLRDGARFCDSCGTATGTGTASAQGAVRKVVSVVFCDLTGSTALQETLDPESVRRVMARFYEVMRAVVERHGGQVQKFIGDAVVAAFGTRAVSEDDALRAVRCAFGMGVELGVLNNELDETWGVRLQMRTGVNTGELVISDEEILVGDVMNTAARLEQSAGAGNVLIGEATWRLVRHLVELEEVAPLDLKGKTEPVRAWQLISVNPKGAAGIEAPLVGRSPELARLRKGLDDAISARACRLVTVIGSPGLGKSRLAAEFASSLRTETTVVEGHCEASGEGITFLPVAEVLRSAGGIEEADPPEIVFEKLTGLVSDDPERSRVVARAAALLGAGDAASPEETFWGVRRVLESLARRAPLVVLLDDLHWGQPMFLDLVEHLVEWVRDAPILLVALARPELRETREALAAAGRRPVDVIELEPLEPGESRELVEGLLGVIDLPGELLRRILETTEGNPLFLGELLRMLVDEGSLSREGDVWVVAGGAEAVEVPPTIQALLTARIERLRSDERSVVERAAVIGKQFYRGAVAELVALPIRLGIDGHLETLRRKDMVEPEGTYWIDEPVYRFHHVLIRDAAYHLLLKEARAELHERFAEWLETKAGDLVGEHEEVIAYHLEQAHEYRRQLGPLDDRGRAIGVRAAAMFASAGRRALAREDLAAAANLLQRALDRDPDADVLWDLGEALLSAGETAQAADVVARLSGPRADVLEGQLGVLTGTGSLEPTLERVTAATATLAATGDAAAEAKGHHVAAAVQAQLGRVADVETSLDQALLAARKAEDRRRITAVLAAAPRAALWGPSPVVRASGRCLDVVRILRMTPGNRHVEAVALRCQAVLEAMRGRADAAREILESGRATLEELGLTLELHELAMHAGIVELLAGRADSAEELLRSARDGFAALGVSVSAAQAAALLARALVEQGRDSDALAETEYAEEHAGGDLKTTITWLGVRAEALGQRELAERAVALAEPTDALADKADAHMALARVLRASGQSEGARKAADAARSLYEAKDHAVGVQRAGELAQVRVARQPPAAETTATIEDLELAGFLERYASLVAARDIDAFVELHAPDWVAIDHRQLGWGERRDIRAEIEVAFAESSDIRFDLDEVIACGPGVIAVRVAWRGHSGTTGGGEFELPGGIVMAVRDGLLTRAEIFEPDAETSMRACLEDLRGRMLLGDREPERWQARWIESYGRHDREGLAALWAEECEFVDRRELSWQELRGRQALLDVTESTWDVVPDNRCAVDDVLACDERVLALTCTFRGTAADGGGPTEIAFGWVEVIEDGLCARVEQFDHEDREGLLARYRELGGTLDVLGNRPPERWWAEFKRRFDAHDLGSLVELYHEDWSLTDHRQLAMEVPAGPGGAEALWRSAFDGSQDVRADVDEVIASDERVIALAGAYRGTAAVGDGEFEIPFAVVTVVEDGRTRGTELFDPDDRVAIMARWREVHGLGLLGDLRPERFWARWVECYARHDRAGILEIIDEDYTFVDRRSIGWEEQQGREEFLRVLESGWAMWDGGRIAIDEVLAVDDRTCAVRCTFLGAGTEGGGPAELPVGYVADYTETGFRRVEQFEHEDTDGMLARYRELGGTVESVLGDRQPERVFREWIRLVDLRDAEAVAALVTDDHEFVDHRKVGWDSVKGRAGVLELNRSVFGNVPDIRIRAEEVIACDDRVLAITFTAYGEGSHGSGPWAMTVNGVVVVEDGRLAQLEFFEPEDRGAVLARFEELGGQRPAVLGDRPPERLMAEIQRLQLGRDYAGIAALVTDDWYHIDHRPLAWPEAHGREECVAIMRSVYGASPDMRVEYDEILAVDDDVVAVRQAWRGRGVKAGEYEVEAGAVYLFRDGLWAGFDFYEPADRQAMMARYAELGGGLSVVGDSPLERILAEWVRRYAARELKPLMELIADDIQWVDHRNLAWEPTIGRPAVEALVRSALGKGHGDIRMEVDEVLAVDDRVLAFRFRWLGQDGRGCRFEIPAGQVNAYENGRCISVDQYDADDRETMLARFVELGGRAEPVLGARPSEQVMAEIQRVLNARDYERLGELVSDDWYSVDHRALGWEEAHGREACLAAMHSMFDASPSVRIDYYETIACDDRLLAVRASVHGHGMKAGEHEVDAGCVYLIEDGRWAGVDFYEPADHAAMIARYAELGGEPQPEALRLAHEVVDRWNAHDADRSVDLYAENAVILDHRPFGAEPVRGKEAVRELFRVAFEVIPDSRQVIDEVIACDERAVAFRVSIRGTSPDAAGADAEVPIGGVDVFEDGKMVSADFFDPDDRVAIVARYVELGGGLGKLGDTASEKGFAEYARRYAARDLDGLLSLLSDDWVQIDHRQIGLHGYDKEQIAVEFRSAWEGVADIRVEVDQVLAADEYVFAGICTYRGTAGADAGGGLFEVSVGFLAISDGELWTRAEWFDADDRDAMLARFAELSRASGVVLGDRPIERALTQQLEAFNDHDLERTAELTSDEIEFCDHRPFGSEPIRGRGSMREYTRSILEIAPDVRREFEEVIACADDVIVLRAIYRGASGSDQIGSFEVVNHEVWAEREGKLISVDLYDVDDIDAARARFAELSGHSESALANRPPERFFAEWVRRWAATDVDAIVELYSPTYVNVDHRSVGWGDTDGSEEVRKFVESAKAISPDMHCEVDEVLACDDRVIALAVTWRGTGQEGVGELELAFGYVAVVEDGLLIRQDHYEHDDRHAMIARYAELGGGVGLLGDRPPERQVRQYARRLAARDLEGLAELHAPQWVMIDHRQLGWEEIRGVNAALELVRSGFQLLADIRLEVDEVLGVNDRVIAMLVNWRGTANEGGGEMTIPLGLVIVVESGLAVRHEQYEPEDREAILARFRQLSGVSAEASELRPYLKFDELYNERRLDELPSLYTDDFVMVDRRSMGWEEIKGPDAIADTCRSFLELAPDLKSRCEPIVPDDGGEVILLRNTFSGHGLSAGDAPPGEVELVFIEVGLIRDGLFALTELFDEADLEAARSRYAELKRSGGRSLGDTPAERVVARYLNLVQKRDIPALLELASDDVVINDHRALGGPPASGPSAAVAVVESALGVTSELRYEVDEVIERGDRVLALRGAWIGRASEGEGEIAVPMGIVVSIADGRITSLDLYEPGDEPAIRQRYEELRAERN